MKLLFIISTSVCLFLLSFPVAAGDVWPFDNEIWLDELPRTPVAPDVMVMEKGIDVTLFSGTSAVSSCAIPGKFTKEDRGTFMIKQVCLTTGSLRESSLTTYPVIPNIWVINPHNSDKTCSTIPFYWNQESLDVAFDRSLANGCYIIVFQSALLKTPNLPKKEPIIHSIQVPQK